MGYAMIANVVLVGKYSVRQLYFLDSYIIFITNNILYFTWLYCVLVLIIVVPNKQK